jgi:hypothetical protein
MLQYLQSDVNMKGKDVLELLKISRPTLTKEEKFKE